MTSLGQIALRTASEREYDEREAAESRDDIAEGERAFKELVASWSAKYAGDEDAISGYLDDFLCDYFYERRRAADMIEEGEL